MNKFRIWFQGATDKVHMAPYIAKVEAHLKAILEPDFEATFHTTTPPATTTHAITEFRIARNLIRNAVEAERQGYAAMAITHFQDAGLAEVKSVVDIPVPTSVDLNSVNDVLHRVGERAMRDPELRALLLDTPQLMGVESIQVDTVNLRMVARTLPGKQFEVGRRLRILIIAALAGAGIATQEHTPTVSNISASGDTVGGEPAAAGRSEQKS